MDSIKVYVKTKEGFGWPEDTEDFAGSSSDSKSSSSTNATVGGPSQTSSAAGNINNSTSIVAASAAAGTSTGGVGSLAETNVALPMPLTAIDRMLASALEVLDGIFATQQPQTTEVSRDFSSRENLLRMKFATMWDRMSCVTFSQFWLQ